MRKMSASLKGGNHTRTHSVPVDPVHWFRLLVASPPVQDLLLRANYLFVPAMMGSAPTGEPVQQAAFR
jgi:hypothetical protein